MLEPNRPEAITPETFVHLVQLAALHLSVEEAEYLRKELNRQIHAIGELESLPPSPAQPAAFHGTAYPQEIVPSPRSDCWAPFPNPEEILRLAPETEAGYYVVPDLPHQDIE